MTKHQIKEYFKPLNYKIDLNIDPTKLEFSGIVNIIGDINPENDYFFLNAKDLAIDGVSIDGHLVEDFAIIQAEDLLKIKFEKLGKHTVKVLFSGKITDEMHGLYPCRYKDKSSDEEVIILATQFESHHARELFPCIDEPGAKASFDLSITLPAKQTVLSNTNLINVKEKDSKFTYTFETTPVMSTYLLAMVVGDLKYHETTNKHGVILRSYANSQTVDQTKYALDIASKVLDFYQDYFGIEYPLPKCDLVSLPEFDAGAMENWGLITFRETAILVDEENSSILNRQYVALVVAHELAHQWFGNLVTMKWWTDLWLNEGFASWMEYFVIDKLYPDWQLWLRFYIDETSPALKLDALSSSHPIVVNVDSPDMISSIFDTISYNKGASVIRMLHDYLGANDFQKGLQSYLKKFAYKNTETLDLWQSLSDISGKDVAKFMSRWTDEPGFPIVSITRGKTNNSYKISQTRFLLDNPRSLDDTTAPHSPWSVPLYIDNNNVSIIENQSQEINIPKNTSIVLNRRGSGFYRTSYCDDITAKLLTLSSKGELEPISELVILNDNYELNKVGQVSLESVFRFISKFQSSDNALIWQTLSSQLSGIETLIDSANSLSLHTFANDMLDKKFNHITWQFTENSDAFDSIFSQSLISLGIISTHQGIVAKSSELFTSYKNNQIKLSPNISSLIYTNAILHDNKFEYILDKYKKADFAEEIDRLSGALCQARQVTEIQHCLELIKSKYVRQQDIMRWIALLSMNKYAANISWKWVNGNWDWLNMTLKNTMAIAKIPQYLATQTGDKFLNEYKVFFSQNKTKDMEQAIENGIKQITWRTAWKKRLDKEIQSILGSM